MSADILRRAAALMRERAEAATLGPWDHEPAMAGRSGAMQVSRVWSRPVRQTGEFADEVADCLDITDAAHIASWHPAVALAVADWLEATADDWDRSVSPIPVSDCRIDARAALNMARAYLGEVDQ